MGSIQLNEKLGDWKLDSFETKAVGFCEHAAHVIVIKFFINFSLQQNRTDRQTCEWMNSMEFRVSLLAKHWTYQTLDKNINAAVVILPI